MDIKDVIKRPEYNFLKENPKLKNSIMFLTYGGSHAYGTNIETSDIDIRGVSLNTKAELIGLDNCEQIIDNNTDTTIYRINKVIHLLSNCNPNTIEMLGCNPEHYIFYSKLGKLLVDNKDIFLSKKAIYSFGGYANQQLRRLENALARDNYPQADKEKHIMKSCEQVVKGFNDKLSSEKNANISMSVIKSNREDLEAEIVLDMNLKQYPLRDMFELLSEFNNTLKSYSTLNKRNRKKDDLHLNKHSMHLVRLYLMCFDILEKKEINTYRKNDIDMLLSIRNGKFQKEDGSYDSSFFDLINEYEKRLKYAEMNTDLPKTPNYREIEKLLMYINSEAIRNG